MTKVLCTGIAGFIGSHLCDYLIEQGHEVLGIDDLSTGDKKNVNPKAMFKQLNIKDKSNLNKVFKNFQPDWVFHEAANARPQRSVDEPLYNHEVNITGTLNVLLASRDTRVKRFIFASSCILNAPNTPYYVSKLAGEEYCKVFSKIYNLPTVCLRYSNVYGSLRQSGKGPFINALASLRKSKRETGRIWITGDGTQVRDWTHVTDIAIASLLAAKSEATGVFDICTGIEISMNEIAKYFNCPIDYVPARLGDQFRLGPQDSGPAFENFGYKYEIPINKKSLRCYLD